ncbi:MAG: redoxin family protein [Alphaproteobacteria bacterium]
MVLLVSLTAFSVQAEERKDYYMLSPDQIARFIDGGRENGRRVVFIYASWCGYCRAALPEIMKIEEQQEGSVVAISIDKDPETFRRYIQSRHGELPFPAIVWNRKGSLHDALARFGIEPGRGIPFTALLDEYGYVHQQGVIRPADSARYILSDSENL